MKATIERALDLPLPKSLGDQHAFRGILHCLLHRGGTALSISMHSSEVAALQELMESDRPLGQRLLGSNGFPQFNRQWPDAESLWFALSPTEQAALNLTQRAVDTLEPLQELLDHGQLHFEVHHQDLDTFTVRLSWPHATLAHTNA